MWRKQAITQAIPVHTGTRMSSVRLHVCYSEQGLKMILNAHFYTDNFSWKMPFLNKNSLTDIANEKCHIPHVKNEKTCLNYSAWLLFDLCATGTV